MSIAATSTGFVTFEEYIRIAEASDERLEYSHGRIVNVTQTLAMAGGSPRHSSIIANLIGEVRSRLKGTPCRVYDSNLRVSAGDDTFTCLPDAMIVCGPGVVDPHDKSGHTYTNSTAVFKVLSPSTIGRDFGEKFINYRDIATLREYVLVRQDRVEIATFLREDDGRWRAAFHTDRGGGVRLESAGIDVSLAEVYDGVDFAEAAD